MDTQELKEPEITVIRPATLFAFIKVFPMILCAIGFLFLAWYIMPVMIWLSLVTVAMASYRYSYIRRIRYIITPEVIRITRGILFKRTDQIELFRVKDYVLTQSLLLQVFRLMDLELKSTDPENPVIWMRGIPLSNLVDTIRDRVQQARQHNRIYEIN